MRRFSTTVVVTQIRVLQNTGPGTSSDSFQRLYVACSRTQTSFERSLAFLEFGLIRESALPLTLFVTGVRGADHIVPPFPSYELTMLADSLHTRADLHRLSLQNIKMLNALSLPLKICQPTSPLTEYKTCTDDTPGRTRSPITLRSWQNSASRGV